ncbi:MAG TPA: hypothetical protein VM513_04460 [Kofleriaceae bacterium]|jgi:hypothetical protein|nr:hypothetical protein [Kofleriaceae bacterium]
MIEIEVKGGRPEVLAELIVSAVEGRPVGHPEAAVAQAGLLAREQMAAAESRRPSRHDVETVNFQTLDEDEDWTDL